MVFKKLSYLHFIVNFEESLFEFKKLAFDIQHTCSLSTIDRRFVKKSF